MLWWSVLFALMGANTLVLGGSIEEAPSNVTVALGGMATIRCIVNKDVGDKVHWLLGDLQLFDERDLLPGVISDGYRFSIIGTGNDYSLKIAQITANDAERYTCKIQSGVLGEQPTKKSAYLIVHRPPRMARPKCKINMIDINNIEQTSETFTYQAGQTVLFQCDSDRGYPETDLQWSDYNGSVNTSLDESRQDLTLYFKRNLTSDDNQQTFTCNSMYTSSFVRNQSGSCEIGPLNVQFPPDDIVIDGLNVDIEGNADFGKSIFLTCKATGGNPDIMDYNWTTIPYIPPERYQKSMHVFTLLKVEEEDQGLVINCAATNNIGEGLRTNITLNVTNLPTTTIPTTIISTKPDDLVSRTKVPIISMSFSTTYVIIVILVALVILLGTVCCVLFLVNRRKPPKDSLPLQHMPDSQMSSSDYGRSMSYNRQFSADTLLEEDACSLKGKSSQPGTPCMERRLMDVEAKLHTLQRGKFDSQSNIYGDSVSGEQPDIRRSPLPHRQVDSSPEPDDLKKPGRKTPRDSPDSGRGSNCHSSRQCLMSTTPGGNQGTRGHKKLKPTNSSGPDWPVEKSEKYSPLARRHYSTQEQLQSPSIPNTYNTVGASPRTRRATHGEVEEYESQNREPVKGHRRNRSHGSNPNIIESPSIMVSPSVGEYSQQHSASPVMQRKHRRQTSGGSLHQLQIMQQQDSSSRHTSPRPSPRTSPHSSPQHRPTHKNRPLPDPGLDSNDDLLIQIEANPDHGLPSYSNRTPVMVRKPLQRPQQLFTPESDYSDDDDDEDVADYDEEYDDYVEEGDVCSIHGEGVACDCNNIQY